MLRGVLGVSILPLFIGLLLLSVPIIVLPQVLSRLPPLSHEIVPLPQGLLLHLERAI